MLKKSYHQGVEMDERHKHRPSGIDFVESLSMNEMIKMNDFEGVVVAGLLGTLLMSLFTTTSFLALKQPYHVVRTLALIFKFGRRAKITASPDLGFYMLAAFVHYAIGVMFAYCYWIAIAGDVLARSWGHAILFGIIIGLIAITAWRIFLGVFNNPLHYNLKIYLTVICLGHIVLALTFYFVHKW